jgi:hypothetical protein
MNVTDYTKPESTLKGCVLPSRFASYLLDLLKIFFSDPRNIPVDELKCLKYVDGDTISAINSSDVYLDVAWPEDQRISGKTPAILVNYGQTTAEHKTLTTPLVNSHFPGNQQLLTISYDMILVVRTAAYAGTQALTELLFNYLRTFSNQIRKDANVSSFIVTSMTPPELSQSPGDVKDVFKASIVCKVAGTYVSTVDTTGPVFRGITIK